MTNEDAIQLLLQMKDGIIHVFEGDRKVALENAISALEKQDVSDTNVEKINNKKLNETQKPLDTISRQAALNMVYDREEEFGKDIVFLLADYIEQLPSVQQEIIHCRDCAHYYFADNRIPLEQKWTCGLNGDRWKSDDFCSFAKRKTDRLNDIIQDMGDEG